MRQATAAMLSMSKEGNEKAEDEDENSNANPDDNNRTSMKANALKLQGILKRMNRS